MVAKKSRAKSSLTPKQKRFCEEYLIDMNATQAAIRAGYSERTAYSMGQRLLKKVEVQEYIQKRMASLEYRTGITQERVLNEIAAVAFANITDYAQVVDGKVELTLTKDLTDEQKKGLAVIKEGKFGIEVKAYDKLKALQMLGDYLSLFTDKQRLALEQRKVEIEEKRLEIEQNRQTNGINKSDYGVVILAPILSDDKEEAEDE